MGVATIQAFTGDDSGDRLLPVLVLVAAAIALPVFMATLARTILRHATAMDAERAELLELYDKARLDALLDALTGLGNHGAFQDELARQLEAVREEGAGLALLLVDVDDLKTVNDRRGHAGGDEVLTALGRIVATNLRRPDRAYRIGGDELAILLPATDLETALSIARRILASALGGGDPGAPIAPFSLTIGVSAVPEPTADPRRLYRNADGALYWGKRHGRTTVVGFDPRLHGDAAEARPVAELADGIEAVLTSRAVRPVYQPIFSMETGRPIGYESLVRPTQAAPFRDAGSMFQAAEAVDRTVELDFLCLDVVASGVGDLEDGVYISVNLSPRTLESEAFHVSELKGVFNRHAIPLHQVVLELTEREQVENLAQLRTNVAA